MPETETKIRYDTMKKYLSALSLAVLLIAGTGYSQVLNTNTGTPTLSGPFVDLLGNLSTATNWGVATFAIKSDKTWGAGAVALYNINPYVATGVGVDWLDNQVTMPSGQIQFQAPLLIGGTNGVLVRPFAFTGVATPIGGMGQDNGNVVGLFGAGLGVRIYSGFNAFYAIEQRTGQDNVWHLFGIAWSKEF